MGQILLVRHGQASLGTANYDQLSPLGQEQALQLGLWFERCQLAVARAVSGDLQRHQQTARACLGGFASDLTENVQIDAGWNEFRHEEVLVRHYPAFADPTEIKRFMRDTADPERSFQQLFVQAMRRWMSGDFDHDYSESWPSFRQHCVAALERQLSQAKSGESIIIFTSAGTISTICQHILGLSAQRVIDLSWNMTNCGVTKLRFRSSHGHDSLPTLSLEYLNSYAHFESDQSGRMITYR